ncbi:MAG: benzoylformate decarboxylase [Solirubrobacterales bacterium]|nr:benzoylformate decarboxylase [Solirubrobacterales bacterium]
MTSVRDATFELFRARGMTTIFGNPGSTELPMLAEFPPDFRYVLGLQELVVVGMADGFAQASGRPTHVNLHTAPGVGNAVGGILNAHANKAPLVITAGQQVRAQMTMESLLTNRDAIVGPAPYVKYAIEPPRAQDVPGALARAIAEASLPPRGPTFVSIPMDDWEQEADLELSTQAIARRIGPPPGPDPDALADLARRLQDARAPALVAGPGIDAAGGWEAAIALAGKQRLSVFAPPTTGGSRIGFPESHPRFAGILPPAIGPLGQALAAHDLVVVVGSAVFPYYPYVPGPLLAAGTALTAITDDPREAARAPMGDAILGDVALALRALVELVPESERPAPPARAAPGEPPPADPPDRLSGSEAMAALADAWPQDGIAAVEPPSSLGALRNRLRLSEPGSLYFTASGGLGFAIAASVGIALAQAARPVVCVVGEGSAQYGITALWTAAAHRVPVTFLVLRNDDYSILRWFAQSGRLTGIPGLELPGLDVAAVARAYGVPAREVATREELTAALREAIADRDGPSLVQVPVAPGMWTE